MYELTDMKGLKQGYPPCGMQVVSVTVSFHPPKYMLMLSTLLVEKCYEK
jgi:hypothetical protein